MTVREEDKTFIAQVHCYIFIGHHARLDQDDMAEEPEMIVDRLALWSSTIQHQRRAGALSQNLTKSPI